jgi:hypothetical protein
MSDILKLTMVSALRRQVLDRDTPSQMAGWCRPNALAWAILALQNSGLSLGELRSAREKLCAHQQPDGRLAVSPDHPEASWPTPIAVLAWEQDPEFRAAQAKAIAFLLKNAGYPIPAKKDSPFSHNTALKGWPWIDGTHSWVIPTAFTVLALRVTGQKNHARVAEALHLLLDRQLDNGGWNYGNTVVFRKKLLPMPESTGIALSALSGIASSSKVAPSLAYLKTRVASVRTPLSLSWSLLGLAAWGKKPPEAEVWLQECWQRQARYGEFDLVSISLLLIALTAPDGFISIFAPLRRQEI